jgi:hypothetical protein
MPESKQGDWKMQTYLRGGLIGLMVGLIAAHLYTRAAEETNGDKLPARVSASDLVKVSLAILGLVRQITELGNTKQ